VVFIDTRGCAVTLAATRRAATLAEAEARLGGLRYEVDTMAVGAYRRVVKERGRGDVVASIRGVRLPRPFRDRDGTCRSVYGDVSERWLALSLRAFMHYPVLADSRWLFLLGATEANRTLELELVWMLGAN
jgi:hypothetical protein